MFSLYPTVWVCSIIREHTLYDINPLKFISACQTYGLFLRLLHVYLRRIFILLFSGKVFYGCLLGIVDLQYCLRLLFPC